MTLVEIAEEQLRAFAAGEYTAPSGRVVAIRAALAEAVAGTVLWTPDAIAALPAPEPGEALARVEVTRESTAVAARRLCAEGERDPLLLNFASAKNPGGGFLRGAKAQEEDLSRVSGLYPSLMTKPRYYEANRAHGSLLYTDHAIYSPRLPFFRDDAYAFLEEPFLASVLTSPAPNAGEARQREGFDEDLLRATLRRRAAQVLRLAREHGHRVLVLGAWGCGVFRNDPSEVAEAFALALAALPGAFDRVVFAIYEGPGSRPPSLNLTAFSRRFERSS